MTSSYIPSPKPFTFVLASAATLAGLVLPACSDDETALAPSDGGAESSLGGATSTGGARNTGGAATGGRTNATGGAGGATGGAGGQTTGGTANTGGASTGGAANTGGVTNTGGATSSGGSGNPEAGVSDGGSEAGPDGTSDAGLSSGIALASMTNFGDKTEIAVVDLSNGNALASHVFADQDSVPVAHGNLGFILERTVGHVNTLNANGSLHFKINLDAGDAGGGLNPQDVVPVPGKNKAYVSLYAANRIDIIDLSAGNVTGSIDLGAFNDTQDTDGAVEASAGVYDPTTNRVYFGLQRLSSFGCSGLPSLLVGIDPTNDSIVDLNGAVAGDGGAAGDGGPAGDGGASGKALALKLTNPAVLAIDSGKLFVLASGCSRPVEGGSTRVGHGVEVVTLATGSTAVPFASQTQDFLAGFALAGSGGLVGAFVGFNFVWSRWDLTSPTLGASLTAVPEAAVIETAETMVGIGTATAADGGSRKALVRYVIASGTTSVVAVNPWTAGLPYAGSVAVVR